MEVIKSSFRASLGVVEGYTDEVEALLKSATYGLSALETLVDGLESTLGAVSTAAATGVVSDAKLAMAYLKQLVTQNVSCMIFPSAPTHIVVIPGTGADLDFPSVVVAGLPTGANILRADMLLVIGALFDTSAAENQIKAGTTDQLQVKVSTGSWVADDIPCLNFPALGLQVDADAYRGGAVLMGATDIKAVVVGDGTYNFRSVETTTLKGVESTGGGLELLDVTTLIRVWFS